MLGINMAIRTLLAACLSNWKDDRPNHFVIFCIQKCLLLPGPLLPSTLRWRISWLKAIFVVSHQLAKVFQFPFLYHEYDFLHNKICFSDKRCSVSADAFRSQNEEESIIKEYFLKMKELANRWGNIDDASLRVGSWWNF